MKKIFFITTFVVFIFIPISLRADIIINEIAWMGTDISTADEWIELKNTSSSSIDLTGYILEAMDDSPSIILEGTISDYFLLERTDDTSVPTIAADQIYTGALSNTGEYLQLKNNGVVVDEIDASDGWLAGDNTTKQTMQLVDSEWETGTGTPKAENAASEQEIEEEVVETTTEETTTEETTTPSTYIPIADAGNDIIGFIGQEISFNGASSSDPNGYELAYSWNMGNGELIEKDKFTYIFNYPGTYLVTLMVYNGRNYAWNTITVKIQSQQITINEFIPNPEGKDEENEWIEIYNDSDSIVDISGWQLDDEDGGSKPFIFPENSLMAPKNYLVFSRQITGIALNNDKDSIRLLLPEGMVFQEVNYENPKQEQSSARTDQGFVWSVPTPGMANLTSSELIEGIKKFTYQQPIESETTKESSQDYSWYFQNPEQKIEKGFTIQEPIINDKDDKDKFAAVSDLALQEESKKNQATLNLVLMIIAVILAGLIIGLFLTKLSKKFP